MGDLTLFEVSKPANMPGILTKKVNARGFSRGGMGGFWIDWYIKTCNDF